MAITTIPNMTSNLATVESNADAMVDDILNDPNAASNSATLLKTQKYLAAFNTMVLLDTNNTNAKTTSARKIVGNIN